MRLPTADSAVMRGIKTTLQVVVAFLVWAAADANIRGLLLEHYPQWIPILAITAGLLSTLYNVVGRGDVANY